MSIKSKILKLLAKEELTSSEVSEKLYVKLDNVRIYLNTLFKENKVERITKKKPYIYRAITPLRYLIDLHSIMDKRMDFTEKPTESEQQIILKLEELIK